MNITAQGRILGALPTVKNLLNRGAAVILCSHLGRPKGKVDPKYSLAPVAKRLSELLEMEVPLAADVTGPDAAAKAAALQSGQAMLLENLRYDPREEKNDPEFAKELADMADIYVSDAFGTVHRAHASTAGVAAYLPAVAGLLIEKELEHMGGAMESPVRPLTVILGGSKVSDKIELIENMLTKADNILIGGGMAYTFLKTMGGNIGKSLCEDDKLELAAELLQRAAENGVEVSLPADTVAASAFAADASHAVFPSTNIPDGMLGLDIGPAARESFAKTIASSGTVIWNGPMGVFEMDAFAEGTRAIARALGESSCQSIIGGGDSAAAVEQLGFADKMTLISTGGGASLEFFGGRELPGIACLLDK
ncbi:MAG: phosphoglycerate kinase [Oscillospiraceae bacterium]|nr:phosphoglycerate kinase [Oscillospiraceae bacterium]